jgi:hypothetical protein
MTPEQLQAFIDAVTAARRELLFETDAIASLDAEQLTIMALNEADNAIRFATLAKYALMQGR